MSLKKMTTFLPHLLWANKLWLEENGLRVNIVVKGDAITDKALRGYIHAESNTITLNISDNAVTNFKMDASGVFFNARFKSVPYTIAFTLDNIIHMFTPDDRGIALGIPFEEFQVKPEAPKVGRGMSSVYTHVDTSPFIEDNVKLELLESKSKPRPNLSVVKTEP